MSNYEHAVRDEAQADIKSAKKLRLPWWGIILLILTFIPMFWIFDNHSLLNISLPIFDCVGMFSIVLYVKRNLFGELWFWLTMAALALLHVLLIWAIPWTGNWIPAPAAAAVGSIDICLMLWLLAALDTWVRRGAAN